MDSCKIRRRNSWCVMCTAATDDSHLLSNGYHKFACALFSVFLCHNYFLNFCHSPLGRNSLLNTRSYRSKITPNLFLVKIISDHTCLWDQNVRFLNLWVAEARRCFIRTKENQNNSLNIQHHAAWIKTSSIFH